MTPHHLLSLLQAHSRRRIFAVAGAMVVVSPQPHLISLMSDNITVSRCPLVTAPATKSPVCLQPLKVARQTLN